MAPRPSLVRIFRELDALAKVTTNYHITELISMGIAAMDKTEPLSPADDPFGVLDLRPSASEELVKRAYRVAAWKYHPDTGHTPDPAKFNQATEAYTKITKGHLCQKEEGGNLNDEQGPHQPRGA